MKIRQAAVAGFFYPADRDSLDETVTSLLEAAALRGGLGPTAPKRGFSRATTTATAFHKAVVAPHAGYIYSGPVAASAYRWLAEANRPAEVDPGKAGKPERGVARVILLGPAHRVPFRGLAVSGADAFESPLGLVGVDSDAIGRIASLPFVHEREDAHELEHSLEVHLPFLQRVFPAFRLVPLVVGDATPAEVEATLRLLWGGIETVVVVSSDLSHYLEYEQAQRADRVTATAIEALRPQDIGPSQACGAIPVKGLLSLADALGLRVRTLDLRNSGDTAGPRDRVVGYGAFAFAEPVS
jgi:AmmeMemoRadiSam system protein B